MTTIRATDATIEISRDGEHWASFPSGFLSAQALSFFPGAQEAAYYASQAEEECIREGMLRGAAAGTRFREFLLGSEISLMVTRWNRGMIERLGDAHTRHAMRSRMIARYIRKARDQ